MCARQGMASGGKYSTRVSLLAYLMGHVWFKSGDDLRILVKDSEPCKLLAVTGIPALPLLQVVEASFPAFSMLF